MSCVRIELHRTCLDPISWVCYTGKRSLLHLSRQWVRGRQEKPTYADDRVTTPTERETRLLSTRLYTVLHLLGEDWDYPFRSSQHNGLQKWLSR